MAKPKKRETNGDTLKINGGWKDAMRTAIHKPKPVDGWPERPVTKRKRRKKK